MSKKKLGTSFLVSVWQCVQPLHVWANEILLCVYVCVCVCIYISLLKFSFSKTLSIGLILSIFLLYSPLSPSFFFPSLPLSYFLFQLVLHDWCNKGCGMYYPVCGMVHIKDPLMLIGNSSSYSGNSGFLLLISEWSFTI